MSWSGFWQILYNFTPFLSKVGLTRVIWRYLIFWQELRSSLGLWGKEGEGSSWTRVEFFEWTFRNRLDANFFLFTLDAFFRQFEHGLRSSTFAGVVVGWKFTPRHHWRPLVALEIATSNVSTLRNFKNVENCRIFFQPADWKTLRCRSYSLWSRRIRSN